MEDHVHSVGKLSACALGFALGVTSALGVFILGIVATFLNFGVEWVHMISTLYIGFAATPVGILIGTLWAFLEGYIAGLILAYAYNFCLKRCKCKSCVPKEKVEEVSK